MRTLYGLTQSPWTEKARWALDHHTLAYSYHEHVPLLGEVLLRLKTRTRPRGTKPSVPLLVDGDASFCSSLAIARHAEDIGRGEPLFPKNLDLDVERWVEVSDRIIGAGRTRVFAGLRTNREAQREALPTFIPGPLRVVLTPMAAMAAVFLGTKHHVVRDAAAAEATLRAAVEEVEAARGGRLYLLDRFTFADIAIAASLQAVMPRKRSAFGPATQAIWTNEALAREHADLLAWRDKIYTKHRLYA
jgi:glutathione S-transferase